MVYDDTHCFYVISTGNIEINKNGNITSKNVLYSSKHLAECLNCFENGGIKYYFSLKKILAEYKNLPKWKGKIFMKDEEICFKDGLEFGYNKANEWHYIKDGDLPKVGQKCCFIHSNFYGEDNKVIFSGSSINVLTGVYTFILDKETGGNTIETCFHDDINNEEIYEQEVYAWKEIALPEEIKEK